MTTVLIEKAVEEGIIYMKGYYNKVITLKDIEEWLADLKVLILDVHICINNARRIAQSKYSGEDMLKKAGFFRHYQYQQIFVIAIQLCKILSDNPNQRRNVYSLFKQLENSEFDETLKSRLVNEDEYLAKSKDDLLGEVARLKELIKEKADLIKKVKEVRDKAYAHYDPDRETIGPSLLEYQKLVDLSREIYNGISLKLFSKTIHFEGTDSWDIDPVIGLASRDYADMLQRKYGK